MCRSRRTRVEDTDTSELSVTSFGPSASEKSTDTSMEGGSPEKRALEKSAKFPETRAAERERGRSAALSFKRPRTFSHRVRIASLVVSSLPRAKKASHARAKNESAPLSAAATFPKKRKGTLVTIRPRLERTSRERALAVSLRGGARDGARRLRPRRGLGLPPLLLRRRDLLRGGGRPMTRRRLAR